MSQKRIKAPVAKGPEIPGVPRELLEVDDFLKLSRKVGDENYTASLRCLLDRFSTSEYARTAGKPPEQLTLQSVHSLINFLNEVFPRNTSGRPLGVPEVALLFGAVIGTTAAPAYVHGEVTLKEIEAQVEIFWIAVREWLTRGFLAVKHIESTGAASAAASKLVSPTGGSIN